MNLIHRTDAYSDGAIDTRIWIRRSAFGCRRGRRFLVDCWGLQWCVWWWRSSWSLMEAVGSVIAEWWLSMDWPFLSMQLIPFWDGGSRGSWWCRGQCLCLIGFAVEIGSWIDVADCCHSPYRSPCVVPSVCCSSSARSLNVQCTQRINPETIIQTFLVHGHPIWDYFMNSAISANHRVFLWGRNGNNECCVEGMKRVHTPQCVNEYVMKQTEKKRIVNFFLGFWTTMFLLKIVTSNAILSFWFIRT